MTINEMVAECANNLQVPIKSQLFQQEVKINVYTGEQIQNDESTPYPDVFDEEEYGNRGYGFINQVNNLLESQPDNNKLAMNEDSMGPIFGDTVKELEKAGIKPSSLNIWLRTILRFSDELSYNTNSVYHKDTRIRIIIMNKIAGYLHDHPDVLKQFIEIAIPGPPEHISLI